MKFKKALKVLTTMSLCAVCMASCAPKVQVREVPMEPPASLLAECPIPPTPEGMTNGTLRDFALAATLHIIDLEKGLTECNADKAAVKHWLRDMRNLR